MARKRMYIRKHYGRGSRKRTLDRQSRSRKRRVKKARMRRYRNMRGIIPSSRIQNFEWWNTVDLVLTDQSDNSGLTYHQFPTGTPYSAMSIANGVALANTWGESSAGRQPQLWDTYKKMYDKCEVGNFSATFQIQETSGDVDGFFKPTYFWAVLDDDPALIIQQGASPVEKGEVGNHYKFQTANRRRWCMFPGGVVDDVSRGVMMRTKTLKAPHYTRWGLFKAKSDDTFLADITDTSAYIDPTKMGYITLYCTNDDYANAASGTVADKSFRVQIHLTYKVRFTEPKELKDA